MRRAIARMLLRTLIKAAAIYAVRLAIKRLARQAEAASVPTVDDDWEIDTAALAAEAEAGYDPAQIEPIWSRHVDQALELADKQPAQLQDELAEQRAKRTGDLPIIYARRYLPDPPWPDLDGG